MREMLDRWRTPALLTLGRVVLAVVCSVGIRDAEAQLTTVLVGSGFDEPIAVVPDPSLGVDYVVERKGLVRVLTGGVVLPEPFVDLRAAVDTQVEGGLLGMALTPDGSRAFFNFTNRDRATVIARFSRAGSSPLRLDPDTRFDLRWPDGARALQEPFAGHNGGHLAFGPDGYLYVGLGDGGGTNDPLNLAQNPLTLFGKMLRLDVRVDDRHPNGYVVPPDNPFSALPSIGLGEIWALGLRNPWRYAFDDFGEGATAGLFIADVGQGAREEINFSPFGAGGRNYGWRVREGRIPTPLVPPAGNLPNFTEPILDYDHTHGNAVIGGFVYRGRALPPTYRGRYFFADYATARVWSLNWVIEPATGEGVVTDVVEHTDELGVPSEGIVSFARDAAGELYLLTQGGHIWKIVTNHATPHAPLDVRAEVDGSTVTLRWQPPPAGPAPMAFRLEVGSVPGAVDIGTLMLDADESAMTVHGVPSGVYYIRMFSVGSAGLSSTSVTIEVRVSMLTAIARASPDPLTIRSRRQDDDRGDGSSGQGTRAVPRRGPSGV